MEENGKSISCSDAISRKHEYLTISIFHWTLIFVSKVRRGIVYFCLHHLFCSPLSPSALHLTVLYIITSFVQPRKERKHTNYPKSVGTQHFLTRAAHKNYCFNLDCNLREQWWNGVCSNGRSWTAGKISLLFISHQKKKMIRSRERKKASSVSENAQNIHIKPGSLGATKIKHCTVEQRKRKQQR